MDDHASPYSSVPTKRACVLVGTFQDVQQVHQHIILRYRPRPIERAANDPRASSCPSNSRFTARSNRSFSIWFTPHHQRRRFGTYPASFP